jgi:hypothetical protein
MKDTRFALDAKEFPVLAYHACATYIEIMNHSETYDHQTLSK